MRYFFFSFLSRISDSFKLAWKTAVIQVYFWQVKCWRANVIMRKY